MSEREGTGASPFTGSLVPGTRPALVLIDLVNAYFDPAGPFYLAAPEIVNQAAALLQSARQHRIPVIHTRVGFTPGGADGGVFMQKIPELRVFEHGNPLGDFVPAVAPYATEPIIVKQYASAFFGTSLASTLGALRVDTVLLAGVSTSGCVRASAVDAIQHGFVPLVVRDAVGDRSAERHESNLEDIQNKYGEVVELAGVTTYLEQLRKEVSA